jgi:protein TonB
VGSRRRGKVGGVGLKSILRFGGGISTRSAVAISLLAHGGLIAALVALDFELPVAPPLSGSAGGGSLVVGIEGGPPEPPLTPEVAEVVETSGLAEPPESAPAPPPPPPAVEPLAALSPEPVAAGPPAAPVGREKPGAPAPAQAPVPAQREPAAVPGLDAPAGADVPALEDPGALRPVYPASCRRQRHEGLAVVRVRVEADGRPGKVELVESAGCPELDRAALEAVRRARFRPARRRGSPVPWTIEQPFRFRLAP